MSLDQVVTTDAGKTTITDSSWTMLQPFLTANLYLLGCTWLDFLTTPLSSSQINCCRDRAAITNCVTSCTCMIRQLYNLQNGFFQKLRSRLLKRRFLYAAVCAYSATASFPWPFRHRPCTERIIILLLFLSCLSYRFFCLVCKPLIRLTRPAAQVSSWANCDQSRFENRRIDP